MRYEQKRLLKKASNNQMIKFTIYKDGEVEETCWILSGENGADDVCYYVKNNIIHPDEEVMEHWLFEMYERKENRDYENRVVQDYINVNDFKKEHGEDKFNEILKQAEESREFNINFYDTFNKNKEE